MLIAMVADAGEATIAKRYLKIMPLLSDALQNASGVVCRQVIVQAMECDCLIAIVVG